MSNIKRVTSGGAVVLLHKKRFGYFFRITSFSICNKNKYNVIWYASNGFFSSKSFGSLSSAYAFYRLLQLNQNYKKLFRW